MKSLKKLLIVFIVITLLYFWSLAFLKSEPDLWIDLKESSNLDTEAFKYEEKEWIQILTLKSGSYYEKWYFHGQKLEKEIKELLEFFESDMLWKDKYLWSPLYSILNYKAKNFIEFIPKENLEEMKWIADWAGVNFNDILLINTYDDLLQLAGCSSMIVPKKDGFNENFVHTRNLDYPIKFLSKYKIVLKYDTHVSVWFPWYIGVLTWIWEKWISLSSHTAYSVNKAEYWIPSGLLYRKVLVEASNLEEVENIFKSADRTIANNVMVGYYKGNTWKVFEFDSKEFSYRVSNVKELESIGMDYQRKILVATNHFRADDMWKFSTNEPWSRYAQYLSKIKDLEELKLDKIREILRYYKDTKYWESISNNGTVQSVIMFPELRKIYIANGNEVPVSKWEYIEVNF